MHLNWGIGQEVPVQHAGRSYRGNVVAIGGYRGAAALVQFFDGEGQMRQQLHRSTAPYPGGFSEASWIADVKAPADKAAEAAEAAAAALAEAQAQHHQLKLHANNSNLIKFTTDRKSVV